MDSHKDMMKLYLTAPPASVKRAQSFSLPIAHLAYRVEKGLKLAGGVLGSHVRNGIMVISDEGYAGKTEDPAGKSFAIENSENILKEILYECRQRQFNGVAADFSGPADPSLAEFADRAADFFAERNIAFYARPRYISKSSTAKVLVSSSVSGGSYRMMLSQMCSRYGAENIALDIARLCHEFNMPSTSAEGTPITRDRLRELMIEYRITPFFSSEMCTNYFTYRDDGKNVHFVLFDDANSLANKIIIAQSMGIAEGFLLYNETRDILSDILSEIG